MGIAEEDLSYACRKDLGFACAGPGDDHYGSFGLVNGLFLLVVKAGVFLFKFLQESFSGNGHCAKLGRSRKPRVVSSKPELVGDKWLEMEENIQ